jgi:hypothetical protein
MSANCIDLRAEYDHRWRVDLDESAGGRWADPWNYRIVCQYGHICPWGDGVLAACTDRPGRVANKLLALPGVTVQHDGDDGATVTFPVGMLRAVAKVMKPRRARRASAKQLAALSRGRASVQPPS